MEVCLARSADASHEPNLVSFGCLVDACAKASQGKQALDALSRARQSQLQPNSVLYNAEPLQIIVYNVYNG